MFRIVVVEDEPTVRRGLVMTMPWSDYECKVIGEAENGAKGLEMILKLKPDIVITDIKMPVMDGLEMMEAVVQKQNTIFVVLSAFNEFSYAQQAIKLGAADYVLKPFKDADFFNALESAKKMVITSRIIQEQTQINQSEMSTAIDRYLSKSKNSKHENILRVFDHIHENFGEDVNISETSELLGVSQSYLSRLFREETSYSFHEYLTVYRIKKACEFLGDPNIKIYEVAEKVGYNDQRYFSIVFKKYMGMSPNHFKERLTP